MRAHQDHLGRNRSAPAGNPYGYRGGEEFGGNNNDRGHHDHHHHRAEAGLDFMSTQWLDSERAGPVHRWPLDYGPGARGPVVDGDQQLRHIGPPRRMVALLPASLKEHIMSIICDKCTS
jgi:hypothetical protein